MTKLISFSLYGEDPKYTVGMIENLKLCSELMPDWKVVIYSGSEIPNSVIMELRRLGAEIELMMPSSHLGGMFWRFLPITSLQFRHLIIRDADSRISKREVHLVNEWISSGKTLHIIRDHPHHAFPILGGLWGVTDRIHEYPIDWNLMSVFSSEFGWDQVFLARHVYPILRKDSYVHDSFFYLDRSAKRPAISNQASDSFVGESFDADNRPDLQKRAALTHLNGRPFKRLLFGLARTLSMRKFLRENPQNYS